MPVGTGPYQPGDRTHSWVHPFSFSAPRGSGSALGVGASNRSISSGKMQSGAAQCRGPGSRCSRSRPGFVAATPRPLNPAPGSRVLAHPSTPRCCGRIRRPFPNRTGRHHARQTSPQTAEGPATEVSGPSFILQTIGVHSTNTPAWRWGDSNPRPTMSYQGFSERSHRLGFGCGRFSGNTPAS